jgi:hypothetical protein
MSPALDQDLDLEAGKGIRWIADQLGHRDPTITGRSAGTQRGVERPIRSC